MPHKAEPLPRALVERARTGRWSAAIMLALAGGLLIALARGWRGVEATLSGHAIELITGQETMAVPARHLLILFKDTSVQAIFVLTSECSVAYLLAALFIGSAPLLLLRKLPAWRTGIAITVTAAILIVVNVARITAIGATVSALGDPGLAIAHTYLGSFLTVVGTCAAGLAFVAVMVVRRRPAVMRPAEA